ncbi:MAG: hypothetical protein Tsb0013_11110 [Phycisphaerales bacterium]
MTHPHHQPDPHQPGAQGDPTLPAALTALLREHAGADRGASDAEQGVETRVDKAVMHAAHERLGEIEPPRTLRFPMFARVAGGFSVAAAAIGLVVFFGPNVGSRSSSTTPAPNTARSASQGPLAEQHTALAESESDNASAPPSGLMSDAPATARSALAARASDNPPVAFGTPNAVTIRDAYLAAIALERGDNTDPAWDTDADGAVDRSDVERLAARAVDLGARVSVAPLAPWSPDLIGTWTLAHLTGSVLP